MTWAVAEGAAGGTISAEGVYVAPAAPGTYHVRATSAVDPARFASAPVTVTGYARSMVRVADPSSARDHHTATLLADGTVLAAGGNHSGGPVLPVDLFR